MANADGIFAVAEFIFNVVEKPPIARSPPVNALLDIADKHISGALSAHTFK